MGLTTKPTYKLAASYLVYPFWCAEPISEEITSRSGLLASNLAFKTFMYWSWHQDFFLKWKTKTKKDEFEIEMRIVDITTWLSFMVHKISQMFPGSKYDANNLTQVWFKSGPSLVQVLY